MPEVVGRLRTPRLATAPSSPALGEVYYDTVANQLKFWNGTAWLSGAGLPADTVVNAVTRIIKNITTAGDTQPAWQVLGSGRMDWGAGGTTATDTSLYRSAASELTVQASLVVGGNSTTMYSVSVDKAGGGGALYFGAAGDFILGRMAAASGFPAHLRVTGLMAFPQAVANAYVGFGNPGLAGSPSTFGGIWYDTTNNFLRLEALTGGTGWRDVKVAPLARTLVSTLVFGTSDANYDVSLYREAADLLRTDDTFHIGPLQWLAVNNGNSLTPQIEFSWQGSSRQYRHWISTNHDGSSTPNNYIDFNLWTLADSIGVIGTTRVLRLSGDGKLWIGNAADTNLFRFAADFLATNDNFVANQGAAGQVSLQASGTLPIIYFGNAQDTNLYRSSASTLRTDGVFYTYASVASGFASLVENINTGGAASGQSIKLAQNTNNNKWLSLLMGAAESFRIASGGASSAVLTWENDTNLYRSAAGKLKSDGTIEAADFTVAGSSIVVAAAARLATGTQTGGITVTDWNNAKQTGFYDGNNATNAPVASTWFLGEVVAHRGTGGANDYISQRVWSFTDTSESSLRTEYVRWSVNSVWSAWKKKYVPSFQDGFNVKFGSLTALIPYGGGTTYVNIPGGWTNHFVFLVSAWPTVTWSLFAMKGCYPVNASQGAINFDNGDNSLNPGGQNALVYWMSIGN